MRANAAAAPDATAVEEEAATHATDAAPSAGPAEFIAEENGVRLTVRVDGRSARLTVTAAGSSGGGDAGERRVLDQFCIIIVGRPLQEAADHGAIYTAALLPEDCVPVRGIRTPRNAGPAFALAERLIRSVHAAAMRQFDITSRDNIWDRRPSAAWLAKTEAEHAAAVKPFIAHVLLDHGLTEEDAWISQIEHGRRLTIAFGDRVAYAIKAGLMMALERRLRLETGEPLEFFMEEMKDANRIRRL